MYSQNSFIHDLVLSLDEAIIYNKEHVIDRFRLNRYGTNEEKMVRLFALMPMTEIRGNITNLIFTLSSLLVCNFDFCIKNI